MSTTTLDQQPPSDDASESTNDSTPTTTTTATTTDSGADRKVMILFQAVGNAPILKKKKYKINASSELNTVIAFLRDKLLRINKNIIYPS